MRRVLGGVGLFQPGEEEKSLGSHGSSWQRAAEVLNPGCVMIIVR